ncbi:MAG TPA: tagaturonate epimerase family protein [Spirochaetota bacterium]|nr:tagaturonate epimerase family protein [Spirochaetota bacterium]
MQLEKYSLGIGDRFGLQAEAQLKALLKGQQQGIKAVPVWNKSFREHNIIKSLPETVLIKARKAVKALQWQDSFYIDADHINMNNVKDFIASSNFFTIDVADYIGKKAAPGAVTAFTEKYQKYCGSLSLHKKNFQLHLNKETIKQTAASLLTAVEKAGTLYKFIKKHKGKDNFITEISMDETDKPQTPEQLFLILAAIADQGIPAQTVALRFSGRFNKGTEYRGNLQLFSEQFNRDLAVLQYAIPEFNLPLNLKLSVHSGSDKFSLYPIINKALKKFKAGLHLKTAGTSWLAELCGLAESGDRGLQTARTVYYQAYKRLPELCKPYAAVMNIDINKLPSPETVEGWNSSAFSAALTHDQQNPAYNSDLRQLMHVAYKIAAEMGDEYRQQVKAHSELIGAKVTDNIYQKHLLPLYSNLS